jgi:hypothetical protein
VSSSPVLRKVASPATLVPVALVIGLVLLLVAGYLLAPGAAKVGRTRVGDTGPVLAGAPLPADGSAGSPTVALAGAATTYPRAAEIRDLVQRWVDANNAHDAAAWSAVITQGVGTGLEAGGFGIRNRTQRLGSVTVRRIDPVGGGELVVPLNYVSTQDPGEAPADVRSPRLCWQVAVGVTTARTGLRITEPRPGSALRTPC